MNDIAKAAEKFGILDRVPIGVCVLREDFIVLYWNRCLEIWTQITKQEIVGEKISAYFPHLSKSKYANRLQQIFAGGPPVIFSSQLHKHLFPAPLPNGELRIQHTTVTAEPGFAGGYYALFSIQDVTELTQKVQDYRSMRDRALAEVKERQKTEADLLQEKDKLQAVLDAVPGLVSWISSDLRYIGVNKHLATTFNQPMEMFIGRKIGFLESSDKFTQFVHDFMQSQDTAACKAIEIKVKGSVRSYLLAAQKYHQGKAAVTVGIDITDRQQAAAQLKASLAEKEVLLKEIHHRVKNNLQIISSLLKLQAEYIKYPEVIQLLNDSYNRVRSMALIHEKLYHSEGLAMIDATDYIRSLVENLVHSYQSTTQKIDLQIEVDQIFFDIDTAIPCGLIVNELISNTLKYAFPGNRPGKIKLNFLLKDDTVLLETSDNGVGLPADFDIDRVESLGLQLVGNLTSQLGGEIEISSQPGASFRITFPYQKDSCALRSRQSLKC